MNLPKLSIIIPTYNEEKYLPKLLKYLEKQTLKPHEIIIGDNSSDRTAEIAREHGCTVTDGPTVGAGRNHGAKKATGDVLLFLDCDVRFKKDFLEKSLKEFSKKKIKIGMIHFNYDSKHPIDLIIGGFMNLGTKIIQWIHPFTHGFSIICTKEIFYAIKGFDETLKLGEDADFGYRASKYGKFRILTSTKIWISPRRLKEEGRFNLCWKLAKSTFKVLTGGKIKYEDKKFNHEFGKHE